GAGKRYLKVRLDRASGRRLRSRENIAALRQELMKAEGKEGSADAVLRVRSCEQGGSDGVGGFGLVRARKCGEILRSRADSRGPLTDENPTLRLDVESELLLNPACKGVS